MKIDLSRYKKLSELEKMESTSPAAMSEIDSDQPVAVIIRVTEANYIPPQVVLRAQIGEYIFTADVLSDQLIELENDPKIQSFSLSRDQRLIE